MSWTDEVFDEQYAAKLDARTKKIHQFPNLYQRQNGFRRVFQELEKYNLNRYKFIETGVLRQLGQWKDGQSTYLFQEFLKYYSGNIYSVDKDDSACAMARLYLDTNICKVYCDNSLNFLQTINFADVNLFHLDSYDVDFKNHNPSAAHHLEEFKIIEPYLKNKLVLIDDNSFYNGKRSGKGCLIYYYLKEKNIFPIHDQYQILYKF